MTKRRNSTFGHQLTKNKRKKTTKKEVRNWLDLPQEIMIVIFMKLGPIEIIFNAQKVCSSWRKLANEPQLYRSIIVQLEELHYFCRDSRWSSKFRMFFKEALHRSRGQLVEVSCEAFLSEQLLHDVVSKPNSLKTLRLGLHVGFSNVGLDLIVTRLPLLEELALFRGFYTENLIEVMGVTCPKLRHLRLDYRRTQCSELDCEKQAFAIARSMTHLHILHLIGSKMSNEGLQAILEGCPKLEYLDIRCCFKITLEGDVLEDRITRIRNIRLPREKIRNWYYIRSSGAPLYCDVNALKDPIS